MITRANSIAVQTSGSRDDRSELPSGAEQVPQPLPIQVLQVIRASNINPVEVNPMYHGAGNVHVDRDRGGGCGAPPVNSEKLREGGRLCRNAKESGRAITKVPATSIMFQLIRTLASRVEPTRLYRLLEPSGSAPAIKPCGHDGVLNTRGHDPGDINQKRRRMADGGLEVRGVPEISLPARPSMNE